jgi:hypothetical protein
MQPALTATVHNLPEASRSVRPYPSLSAARSRSRIGCSEDCRLLIVGVQPVFEAIKWAGFSDLAFMAFQAVWSAEPGGTSHSTPRRLGPLALFYWAVPDPFRQHPPTTASAPAAPSSSPIAHTSQPGRWPGHDLAIAEGFNLVWKRALVATPDTRLLPTVHLLGGAPGVRVAHPPRDDNQPDHPREGERPGHQNQSGMRSRKPSEPTTHPCTR